MRPNSLRTVDPDWFRRRVRPANEDSWDATEAILLADPLERRRIAELTVELAGGGLDRPIIVVRDCWWSRQLRVADGVHRSIAAMRLGVKLPIRCGYPPEDGDFHTDVYSVTAPGSETDALLSAAVQLASFRTATGPWVQCDTGAALPGGRIELCLTHHADLRDAIAVQLRDRLREAGIDAEVRYLETWC